MEPTALIRTLAKPRPRPAKNKRIARVQVLVRAANGTWVKGTIPRRNVRVTTA